MGSSRLWLIAPRALKTPKAAEPRVARNHAPFSTGKPCIENSMLWARCCNTWLRFQGLPATTFSASSRSCTACRAWGQPVKVCRSPVQPASGAAASITDVVLSARRRSMAYSLSKMPAAPWPAPTHIVTMPYLPPVRRRPWMTEAARMAPVAPSGWPSAMAPPLGLTLARSSSMPLLSRSFSTARLWAAKASFSSTQSRSLALMPAAFSAAGMASIGPMPMISGGTPRTAKDTKRASGVRL
mmetsp:Transcript_61304/g.144824  ORF Transcript_61304/g.144824 Transcript_61304/m.144824 type:complete len:241 (+) Transcript_61304:257-979(+)